MRAIAILGPKATLRDVRRFDVPGVQLEPMSAGNPLAGADAALVFGGDGTVHDHLAKFVETQVPMLPVPLGSGNDFHRALGMDTVELAHQTWTRFCVGQATVRPIDLGMISRDEARLISYFCCVAGVGLDSEANRRANAMPSWLRGHGGYIAAVLGAVAAYKPQRITLESSVARPTSAGQEQAPSGPPGPAGLQKLSAPAMFVAFGNAQSYGSGMRITPKAELDDGKLDVCFVREVGKVRLLRLFPTVFTGKHLELDVVEYFQSERIKVETESPLDVYADGEFICRTPVELTVAPKALRVIVAGN